MKIAFFMTTILEFGGGFEQYLIRTASYLSRHMGCQADVVTMNDSYTARIRDLLQVYYRQKFDREKIYQVPLKKIERDLAPASYRKCRSFPELGSVLREYQVVYSKNELLEAAILKYLIGYGNLPPVIFGCHTPLSYPGAHSFQARMHNFLYGTGIYRALASGAKTFHVLNPTDLTIAKKHFREHRIVEIPNPFNVKAFQEQSRRDLYPYQWDTNKKNIVWVGRLTEQKGVGDLCYLVDSLNANGLEDLVMWHIVGEGEENDKVLALASRWPNVVRHGQVESRYMPSIYTACDVLISTSKWESFGMNVLEAQACGLPVIANRIPGPEQIVIEGKTGYLADSLGDFATKLRAVLRMGSKTQAIADITSDRFDEHEIYAALYRELAYAARLNSWPAYGHGKVASSRQ